MHALARRSRLLLILGCTFLVLLTLDAAEPKPGESSKGPLSPREEQATFRLPKGFEIDLVAAEPDVIDPVAMAFDEEGCIFVAEMRGYPNGGVATGKIRSGRIKVLEDHDGDGVYETSRVYADGLRFPTGILPWRGGLLAANAPDILYLENAKGDGKADRRVLYSGFNLANIQQIVNSLQWGLDNWVYGVAGSDGGTIRSPQKPDMPPLTLRNRGIRFHPEMPGSLEATSGGGQYGLAPDDWQHWFTATNSQHLRHIVLPDHYLRRNPSLAVSAVTLDIPDHGAACKVHRISAFEGWRVERTTRRKKGPEAKRLSSTELVPGGYITSACSPVVYAADGFPQAYRGNVFVCDPANNLIHRDVLADRGATFTAKRAAGEENCEFLASTDNWFRPVHLTLGPDGALYVLDFYREVIETPLSLPDDIKKKLNLESRGRGRIWRIRVAGQPRRRPSLRKATTQALAEHLNDGNLWWRLTAQRLLVERQDRSAVRWIRDFAHSSKSAPGRAHALWTLHGLKALTEEDIIQALKDAEPGVREQALRLAEERLPDSAKLRAAVAALADDPSPRVRFQLAFTLGAGDRPETVKALARVARRDAGDRWTQTAVLSSVHGSGGGLLDTLVKDEDFLKSASETRLQLLTRLAALVGATAGDADLGRVLRSLGTNTAGSVSEGMPWQLAVLDGLGQGLQNSSRSLAQLWEKPPSALKEALAGVRPLIERAARVSRDAKRSPGERIAALRLVSRGPYALLASAAPELLTPQTPPEVQSATVRALALHPQPDVAELLLASWNGYGPTVRREVVEALFARADRLPHLLNALEQKKVLSNQLEPLRIEQLRKHANAKIRERARRLLAGEAAPERQKIVAASRPVLELKAEAARGKAVFKKNCAVCHRLENEGFEVGPDLLSALRNKSGEQLLNDILDPSREVDPRYLNYQITTKKGQVFSGLIAADTASSVTLRRGEKAEDTILREQIEEIQATGKSLMPEGLETQLSKQDLADLIVYLQTAATRKN